MPIQIVCPGCQAAYRVKDELRGATVRCKQCERKFVAEPEEDVPEVAAADEAIYAEEVRPSKRLSRQEEADEQAEPARPARYRRDEDEEDQERSRPRRQSKKGVSVALLLMLAFGSVAALGLLCWGVYFAVVSVKDAGKDKFQAAGPVAQQQQTFPFIQPQPQQPAPQAPEGPPDPPPADLVPALVLPAPAVALNLPQPPAAAPAALAPGSAAGLRVDVSKKVRKATVFIRTTLQGGAQPTGSGFFAFDARTVVTNAHVVDMMHPGSKPPPKVEIILNSGDPDEKTYPAQIVGVDRFADLAILRVSVKEPVEPLAVISAQELELTQPVFVFGFPYGEVVGKEVTVSPTQVSSLRRENGVLHRVQVNGGMNPGNSGGPVVDVNGRVIGVSVAVFRNNIGVTNINFAVPGDAVYALFQGRVRDLQLGQPYRDNQNVKVPVTLRLLDPLKRIGKMAVDCWIGEQPPNPGEMRPASAVKPAPQTGDGERRTVELTIAEDAAHGELTLPLAAFDKKVLWVQPTHTTKSGNTSWSSAVPLTLVPPVERKPIDLAFKASTEPMLTDFHFKTNHRTYFLGDSHQDYHQAAQVIEKLTDVDGDGQSTVHLEYKRLTIGGATNRQALRRSEGQKYIAANPGLLTADLFFDRQGNVVKNVVDSTKVPTAFQHEVDTEASDVQNVLTTLSVPLPGGPLSAGQSWKGERRLFGSQTDHPLDNFSYEINYTYQGVRTREGREEAVVLLGGKISAKNQLSVSGRVTGAVLIDVQTSQLLFGRAVLDYDYEAAVTTIGPSAGSNLMHTQVQTEYQLKRAKASK